MALNPSDIRRGTEIYRHDGPSWGCAATARRRWPRGQRFPGRRASAWGVAGPARDLRSSNAEHAGHCLRSRGAQGLDQPSPNRYLAMSVASPSIQRDSSPPAAFFPEPSHDAIPKPLRPTPIPLLRSQSHHQPHRASPKTQQVHRHPAIGTTATETQEPDRPKPPAWSGSAALGQPGRSSTHQPIDPGDEPHPCADADPGRWFIATVVCAGNRP